MGLLSGTKKDVEALVGIQNIRQSPEWQSYLASGRVEWNPAWDKGGAVRDIYANIQSQLAQAKAQDKQIGQYYELATGRTATPEIIATYGKYANDPALLQAAISKGAATMGAQGTYADKIDSAIMGKLGRAATNAEKEYFGKQMEAGNLDEYGLGEFIQGTTEYQTKASDTARSKLAGELGGVDDAYLAKIQKQLESKYAQGGRQGASAFGSSLIQAGKDLATERTGYLAGLGYQDFQRGQDALTGAYQNRLSQMYNAQQGQAGLGQESRQRYYSNQDFARQQAAQERLAKLSQPKQGNFLQGLVPGVIQGAASLYGAYLGRPTSTTNNYGYGPYR